MFSLVEVITQLVTLDFASLFHWLYPALAPLIDYFVTVGSRLTEALNVGIDGFFHR